MSDMSEVRQWLTELWHAQQQTVIDEAVDEWRRHLQACLCARSGHITHLIKFRPTYWIDGA